MNVDVKIKRLSAKYKVELFLIHSENDELPEMFGDNHIKRYIKNNCWCNRNRLDKIPGKIGNILVGIYDEPERKLLSFLHELAHLIFDPQQPQFYTTMEFIEMRAWMNALKLAKLNHISFKSNVFAWIDEYIQTYDHTHYKEPKYMKELTIIPPNFSVKTLLGDIL